MRESANDNANELVEVLVHRETGGGPRAEAELQAYADATRRLYAKPISSTSPMDRFAEPSTLLSIKTRNDE